MSVRATCHLDGQVIDLVITPRPDPDTIAVLDAIHGNCGKGVLECREHDDDERLAEFRGEDGQVHGAWCYLQKRKQAWVICHHPNTRGIRLDNHVIHPMTDQHRWQQDYYARAAQAAGHEAQQEYTTSTGSRVDVLLRGTVEVGIEVQHSTLTLPKVRNRNRKTKAAGITSIWSADRPGPPFAFKVPHVETNELPHGALPRGRWTVTTGPRTPQSVICSPHNSDLMPQCIRPRARNWCGDAHPVWRPKHGVVVDDIAALAPAGELVPLDTRTRQGVILVDSADRDRYLSDFASISEAPHRPDSPGGPCNYRPDLRAAPGSVLDRLRRARIDEDRVIDHLIHGRVRVDGRIVRDPDAPAAPPSRVVLVSGT